jgi:hypothetical protein
MSVHMAFLFRCSLVAFAPPSLVLSLQVNQSAGSFCWLLLSIYSLYITIPVSVVIIYLFVGYTYNFSFPELVL